MLMNIYTVFDAAAQVYAIPYFALNDKMAIRSFTELVNDTRSTVYKYPAEFSLHSIGTYNDSDCTITSNAPIHVISATSVARDPI